jgi:hypothetical protein
VFFSKLVHQVAILKDRINLDSIMEELKHTFSNGYFLISLAFLVILVAPIIIPFIRKIRDWELLGSVSSPKRGTPSERALITQLLRSGIPPQTLFHDLLFEKRNGEYAQIDAVLVTTEGVIVFEVKDYKGWIFGSSDYSYWTQVLAYGKKKHRFYNPIKQNLNHIRTLKKQLPQFKDISFFSVIVFCGKCELKEISYVPKGTYIVKPHRLREVIKQIKKDNPAAPYTNKREVIEFLKEGVERGADVELQTRHKLNIKEKLGKHRIYR